MTPHDFFAWQLQSASSDLSSSAPARGIEDDFDPAHSVALGAWYPLSHGLASLDGKVVFADQAAICTHARREARAEARVVPARHRNRGEALENDPRLRASALVAIMSQGRHSSLSPGDSMRKELPQGIWDYLEAEQDTGFEESADEDCEKPPWKHEDDGCDTLLWRRQITMGTANRQADESEHAGTTASNGDITAEQAANGTDVQGIPWENLRFTREDYRATRMRDTSRQDSPEGKESLRDVLKEPRKGAKFYDFFKNTRRVKCSIVHFQLRNLAWATSNHDVFVMHDAAVVHWDASAKRKSQILDLSGSGTAMAGGLGMVQISTMIAMGDLVIAGGFYGEVIAKNVSSGAIIHNKRITYDENAITNAIDVFADTVMTSNNDCYVRCFDIQTFKKKASFGFPKPVNHATRQPEGKMVAVAGDDNSVQIIDGDSGERIAQLHGHEDYSFATGWHPNGCMFATGSQDKTCRVWDIRNMSKSFSVLGAHTGAVRSLRFSSCGRFLMMAEPRDFVHIFDVNRGEFDVCQEIDLFGEIAGIALTPSAESLYVAVSDRTYSSLVEYERRTNSLMPELII